MVMQQQLFHNPQSLLSLLPSLPLPSLHQLHSHLLKSNLFSSLPPLLPSKLIAAASRLDPLYAHSLLLHLLPSPPPLFAFSSLLHSLSLSSLDPNLSFSLFNSLRSLSLSPDPFSFIAALKSSSHSCNLPFGRQLHSSSLKTPHYCFLNLRNALIHMYVACRDFHSAHQMFDEMGSSKDSISWSTLMNGYAQISETSMVVDLFCGMRRCGVATNPATMVCLLSVVEPGEGEAIHGFCVKSGILLYLNAVTAIASMYVRFERVEDARVVFDETPRRDVVVYNCIVDGYAKRGDFDECLRLFRLMRHERVRMNSSTFVGLLAACASSGALAVGHKVIEIVRAENLDLDASLGTAILDMYVKCGCINESIEVFNKMKNRDVMAWTAMIMGLGIHGRAQDALDFFHEMEEEGLTPNDVTFLAVLNACSHGGMIDLSKEFLKKMIIDYKITPRIKHYGCVIDSLGRAGLLEEAFELINNLPLEGDAMAWRALLAACRVHGEVRIGQIARGALVDLGDLHPTDSILLSRTYASSEKWEDVGRMREMEVEEMKRMEKKEAGCSLIEMSR